MARAGASVQLGGGIGSTRFRALVQSLEERLVAALRAGGFEVELEPSAESGDFVAQRAGEVYRVELRVAREARRAELQATLADALLRARAAAGPGRRPLAVVGAPRVTARLAGELREYAGRFLGGEAFGIVDSEARLELHGPGLSAVAPPQRSGPQVARARPAAPLFSDRSQWLLKVLLAPGIPGQLLAAPRSGAASASGLARLAMVSVPSAARLLSLLRSEGHLELRVPPGGGDGRGSRREEELRELAAPRSRPGGGEGRGDLRDDEGGELATAPALALVRGAELLQRWRAATRRPARELAARWVLPATNPRRQLAATAAAFARRAAKRRVEADAPFVMESAPVWRAPRVCLGLFSACAELGFGPVHGAPQHLYIEEVTPEALADLGLALARPGEIPHVLLRVPAFPESVFRGAVLRAGAPVADLVQCWLDVADHPARGAQLAAQLWAEAIAEAV